MHLELPKFKIARSLLSKDYRVKATWADGDRVVIGGFLTESVAKYWLETEAAHWLTKGGWLSMHNDND